MRTRESTVWKVTMPLMRMSGKKIVECLGHKSASKINMAKEVKIINVMHSSHDDGTERKGERWSSSVRN